MLWILGVVLLLASADVGLSAPPAACTQCMLIPDSTTCDHWAEYVAEIRAMLTCMDEHCGPDDLVDLRNEWRALDADNCILTPTEAPTTEEGDHPMCRNSAGLTPADQWKARCNLPLPRPPIWESCTGWDFYRQQTLEAYQCLMTNMTAHCPSVHVPMPEIPVTCPYTASSTTTAPNGCASMADCRAAGTYCSLQKLCLACAGCVASPPLEGDCLQACPSTTTAPTAASSTSTSTTAPTSSSSTTTTTAPTSSSSTMPPKTATSKTSTMPKSTSSSTGRTSASVTSTPHTRTRSTTGTRGSSSGSSSTTPVPASSSASSNSSSSGSTAPVATGSSSTAAPTSAASTTPASTAGSSRPSSSSSSSTASVPASSSSTPAPTSTNIASTVAPSTAGSTMPASTTGGGNSSSSSSEPVPASSSSTPAPTSTTTAPTTTTTTTMPSSTSSTTPVPTSSSPTPAPTSASSTTTLPTSTSSTASTAAPSTTRSTPPTSTRSATTTEAVPLSAPPTGRMYVKFTLSLLGKSGLPSAVFREVLKVFTRIPRDSKTFVQVLPSSRRADSTKALVTIDVSDRYGAELQSSITTSLQTQKSAMLANARSKDAAVTGVSATSVTLQNSKGDTVTPPNDKSSTTNVKRTAGIAVGVLVLIVLVVAAAVYFKNRDAPRSQGFSETYAELDPTTPTPQMASIPFVNPVYEVPAWPESDA